MVKTLSSDPITSGDRSKSLYFFVIVSSVTVPSSGGTIQSGVEQHNYDVDDDGTCQEWK